MTAEPNPLPATADLLYHFCRLQLPQVSMTADVFRRHLQRAYDLFRGKSERPVGGVTASWRYSRKM